MELLGELLQGLKDVKEPDGTLLDRTMVLYGCHMGDANIHNNKNLPIILAGGGFRQYKTHSLFTEDGGYVGAARLRNTKSATYGAKSGVAPGLSHSPDFWPRSETLLKIDLGVTYEMRKSQSRLPARFLEA